MDEQRAGWRPSWWRVWGARPDTSDATVTTNLWLWGTATVLWLVTMVGIAAFGVGPRNPAILVASVLALLGAAFNAAIWFHARRVRRRAGPTRARAGSAS